MFTNYLKVALRSLFANKLYSFVNICGLAIGLACVIVISLYVVNETSYDRHWENSDRIYRVMRNFTPPTSTSPDLFLATNAPQVAPLLQRDFPELENVVRLSANSVAMARSGGEGPYQEGGIYFADADIYEVFDFPLVYGQWEAALDAPFQMVLTETLAQRYFGEVNPVGESLIINGEVPAEITAVMQDPPDNTHMAPRALVSISTLDASFGEGYLVNWASNNYHTYVLAPEGYDIDNFASQMPVFLNRHVGENAGDFTSFSVIPVTEIHLRSQRDNELRTNGSSVAVYTFSVIAVLILLIACFNFMNLSTARSMLRAREVGMRKIMGAARGQLVSQFLGESLLLTAIAVVLSVGLAELLLPVFNGMLGLELSLEIFSNPQAIGLLALLILVVGLIAGSYPAFFLAEFPVNEVLRGEYSRGARGELLRKALVVLQFSIAIILVIAAGIALEQIRYAMNRDLGINTEHVVVYRGSNTSGLGDSYQTMKQELLRHPQVESVTAANLMPSEQNTNSEGIRFETENPQVVGMAYLNVDFDFFETFEMELVSGRSFDPRRPSDLHVEPDADNPLTSASYILNQAAVEQLGWTAENALGKWFEVFRQDGNDRIARGPVIGVVSDVNFSSLHEEMIPLYYRVMENRNPQAPFANLSRMAVKVSGNDLQDTLAFIEQTWMRFNPQIPVRQSFMDQNFADLYESDRTQGNLFSLFSSIAVVIAALGLFGLAAFMTERRTREIGIRKVLGSTVLGIVRLISWDFCKLVVAANLIAWPVAYVFMNLWLQNFAYRTALGLDVFLFAGMLALLIALITVGSLALNTARRNPVMALRHE